MDLRTHIPWGRTIPAAFAVFLLALFIFPSSSGAGMWDDLKKTVNTAVESSKKQKHEDIGHDVEDDESREAREKKNAAKKKAKASKKTKVKKPVGDDK